MSEQTALPPNQALDLYHAILASTLGPVNRLLDKSSLYKRLLSGKPALAIPPPTAFSYPWYSVVESDDPVPLPFGPTDWKPEWSSRHGVLLQQDVWTRLQGEVTDQIVVTYPGWEELGFSWKVWREDVPAGQTSASIASWHDTTIFKLDTARLVKTECESVASREARWDLMASLHDDSELKRLAIEENWMEIDPVVMPAVLDAISNQVVSEARGRCLSRIESGKPPGWSAEELKARADEHMVALLGDDWRIDGELLLHKTWMIQRITPEKLGPEHFWTPVPNTTPAECALSTRLEKWKALTKADGLPADLRFPSLEMAVLEECYASLMHWLDTADGKAFVDESILAAGDDEDVTLDWYSRKAEIVLHLENGGVQVTCTTVELVDAFFLWLEASFITSAAMPKDLVPSPV